MNRIENEKTEQKEIKTDFKFTSQTIEYRDGEMFINKVTKNGKEAETEIKKILGDGLNIKISIGFAI